MCRLQTVFIGERRLCSAQITENDGPTVAMIHGVLRSWNTFLPLTAALGATCELSAVDQRGHGVSDRADRYLVADYVDDAVRWLTDGIGRPAVLYGHSLGAMVAAGVAAACPQLVRGVILEDPPLETMGRRIRETPFHGYFAQIARLLSAERTTAELAARLADVTLRDPNGGRSVRLGDVRDAAALRFFAATLVRVDPAVLEPIVAGRWLDGYDIDAVFAGVRCPVLLMQADPAAGGMLADADVRRVRAAGADVTHVRLPGVGHMIHWQRTQEAANLALAFIESLDGSA